MTEVYIKYNPYKVETEITIDGVELSCESKLAKNKNERLQVWLDQLIPILSEELNETSFKIIFKGTLLDFEDVRQQCQQINNFNNTDIVIEHIKAKETNDKIDELIKLKEYMETSPFEELRDEKIKQNFQKALDSEFEVSVIATMSSGKSTLINSLLGKELMPSKNQACTATIARIKDVKSRSDFMAKCFDNEGNEVQSCDPLDYVAMTSLNEDEDVSYIDIEGNIPFISSDNMRLVLLDTPGPNNSRNENHRNHTYRVIKSETKPMVLYVLNATQLSTDDDNSLISVVAEQMKIKGKQSKDRFIFAVNKIDAFDPEKGEDVRKTLNDVKEYLEDHGIENPNIYPVSAELAKVIRMHKSDIPLTRVQKQTLNGYELFTEEKAMQMIQYAPLSNTTKEKLTNLANEARDNGDCYTEALYHSGVPSIEAAINEYLEKYAVTAKITNAVNSFRKIVEEKQMMQKIEEEMSKNSEMRKQIHEQAEKLQEELEQGEKSKEFISKIELLDLTKDSKETIRKLRGKIEEKLLGISKKFRDEKISVAEAKSMVGKLKKEIERLQSDILTDLEKMVSETLMQSAQELLDEYVEYVKNLLSFEGQEKFQLGDIKIFTGNIPNPEELIEKNKKNEQVKVGEAWVKNENRKWYKPWTLFQQKGHYEDIIETKTYVNVKQLFNEYTNPIRANLYSNLESAEAYAEEESRKLKGLFFEEFERLDEVIKGRLEDLKELSKSDQSIANKMKEEKEKIEWLNKFTEKLDAILEI